MPVKKKKFNIIDSSKPYIPETIKTELKLNIIQSATSARTADTGHKLYVTTRAMNQIKNHIQWGSERAANKNEQGGILIGNVYQEIENKSCCGIVSEAVPGRSAKGTGTYLRMSHQTWREMLEIADQLSGSDSGQIKQIIGWYHTHPSGLDIFMSGTDKATQKRMFPKDWHYAMVLNPQKKIWRAYYGHNSCECVAFVIG